MNNGNFTLKEVETKLQYYCSYQDRCHKEVHEKLKTFNIIPEGVDQIISNLISENFLNETRFCESFVRGKFKIKNWGKIRIINELKRRNISTYNINQGLKVREFYVNIIHSLHCFASILYQKFGAKLPIINRALLFILAPSTNS